MLAPMPPPRTPPIGLHLAGAARVVGRAFDEALGEAGGSMPVWLVLLNLKMRRQVANQRELAAAVGIREATLTHHLNAMESDGLLTRRRDPTNRRVHLVELTADGEAAFHRLRGVAMAHDAQLRAGFDEADLDRLRSLLGRLRDNVGGDKVGADAVEDVPSAS
jgi:MarR family transcriptional regulator, transcriptional regulator for hemolysin